MNRFIIYTSVNPKNKQDALANITAWKSFSCVKSVKLIQSEHEFADISGFFGREDEVEVISTGSIANRKRSADNPKDLPRLSELIYCMGIESLRESNDVHYIYLNSDIIITDKGFFDDLGPVDKYIALVHRKDVSSSSKDGKVHGFYIHGVDGFCLNSVMLSGIVYGYSDMFYLGLPGWDQYLPLLTWLNGWRRRFVYSDFAIHKMHNTSNPGNHRLFANLLIVAYICEYYLKFEARFTQKMLAITSSMRSCYWMTSVMHKLVVFPALRTLGWKIRRKCHHRAGK